MTRLLCATDLLPKSEAAIDRAALLAQELDAEHPMASSRNLLTAAQCRAARAMVEWSAERLSQVAAIDLQVIRSFEARFRRPDEAILRRIRITLEQAGVTFIPEDSRGAGVRFKFSAREVRAIKRWEAEGGMTGNDAIY
jgi:hypothetical protein